MSRMSTGGSEPDGVARDTGEEETGVWRLSRVEFSRGKEHLTCPLHGILLAGLWPRFRREATEREAVVIEERYQDRHPAVAKDTDQAQLGGASRASPRCIVGREFEQRAHWKCLFHQPADAEQPQGGHGHRQPQSRRALRIRHAGTLPLPPTAFRYLKALFNPGSEPIPTGVASAGGQVGHE